MGVQVFTCGLLILIIFSNAMFCTNLPFVLAQTCVLYQKDLLLELKNNLTYEHSLSTKLVQWNESIDCCQWGGVNCNSRGRVTGLDLSDESISGGINDNTTSLFKLKYLQSLNLAGNSFGGIQLPSRFGQLEGLKYLNLGYSGFSGQISAEFSHLRRLVFLDLSSSYYPLKLENPDMKTLIHNLTQLRELYLDYVNISANGYKWCNAVSSSLPNLSVLSLSYTDITGPFDPSLGKLQSLSVISLAGNEISSPFPDYFADFPNLRLLTLYGCNLSGVIPGKLFEKTTLQTIDLSGNEYLEGSLPESIGNLKMLSQIALSGCRFSGLIPNSLGNLTQLTVLDLSSNQFTGQISGPLWEGLENVVFLDLSGNSLEGGIPASLFVLPSLENLLLNNNRFNGSLRELTNGSSYSLQELDLSVNNLEGPIPQFLFGLRNLGSLSLSRNKFNGSIDLIDFKKLSILTDLDLSHNNLYVSINQNMSSFLPYLRNMSLVSCNLQKFTHLQNMSSLSWLDLSDNKLYGEIPNWIWELGGGNLGVLNLSHNQFTSLQEPYDMGNLEIIDLHSNMLSGQIPVLRSLVSYVDFSNNNLSSSFPESIINSLSSTIFFSLANNNISGIIPPSICNSSFIEFLDLSNNSFYGRMPSCLVKLGRVLNLRRNYLSGDIPDTFSVHCDLETLDLSWNDLQGRVPVSLSRCSEIKVLNLGHNNLTDTFPCSFKNLSRLRVLELRSNNFHGDISCMQEGNYTWPNLQIINLANNNFNGVLPWSFFQKMKALMVDVNGTQAHLVYLHSASLILSGVVYQDSVIVTAMGLDLDLDRILSTFTSVDFSNNHFEGVIPETVGELKSLYVLNFSHNTLSGHIPSSVGNLRTLGSLDLSFNHLDGEIPQQLASLTFLSVMNLSYNKLVGRIPQGNQMSTFSESSFQGNEGLCGIPLYKSCTSPEVQQGESGEEHGSSDSRGIYISAELGFIVGLGVLYAPLLFSRRWRRFFNKHLDKVALFVLRRR